MISTNRPSSVCLWHLWDDESDSVASLLSAITHCLRLNLQLHTIDLVRTCRTSSFCTVAWQLTTFQLTRRIAWSLGDSWASCFNSRWVGSVTKHRSQSKATSWKRSTVWARSVSVAWSTLSNADDVSSANTRSCALTQRWTWVNWVHPWVGLGWVAFSSTCNILLSDYGFRYVDVTNDVVQAEGAKNV